MGKNTRGRVSKGRVMGAGTGAGAGAGAGVEPGKWAGLRRSQKLMGCLSQGTIRTCEDGKEERVFGTL